MSTRLPPEDTTNAEVRELLIDVLSLTRGIPDNVRARAGKLLRKLSGVSHVR